MFQMHCRELLIAAIGFLLACVCSAAQGAGGDLTVETVVPEVGSTVGDLRWISVEFSVEVRGVDADDLMLNDRSALQVTGAGSGPYVFRFDSPSGSIALLSWSPGHGIENLAGDEFGGGNWAYRIDSDLPPGVATIHEFLASNDGGLRDEDGDSSDWIEISNSGAGILNLDGWALSDDAGDDARWVFPVTLLSPGEFLVVFASGKDRRVDGGGELHTNFKLSSAGEYLALLLPPALPDAPREVATSFTPAYPRQRENVSYGLDDDNQPAFFAEPTPGAANGAAYAGFVADTSFSIDRGFFDAPIEVAITSTTADAEIRYTIDGSAPTAATGLRVEGTVTLDGTTTLRAAAFKPGYVPTNVDTQTYLFLGDVLTQDGAGFPATWAGFPADYAVDPDVVNSPQYRDAFLEDLLAVPTVSIVMDVDDLFGTTGIYSRPTASGDAWERPASVEFLRTDGVEGFQINAGVQIFGGASREPGNTGKHSIRIMFKSRYGPTKLDYPMFDDSRVTRFDTIALRAGYNYKWTHRSSTQENRAQYMRDQFARETQRDLGHLASHGRYVHLYLNGLYWGLHNLAERPDESFAASYLGGDGDEYDAIKAAEPPIAISGDKNFWSEMIGLANAGVAANSDYERILEYLDVDSLIAYTMVNHFIGNVDAPVCICGDNRPRNFYAARRRTPEGRFHFFLWDSEHSLSETSVDRTELGVANADDTPARLYGRLRANAEFRMRFADHIHREYFNDGGLSTRSAIQRWEAIATRIDRAIVGESARWGDYRRSAPYTRNVEWIREQSRLLGSFFPVRPAIVLRQYRADGLYPTVDAPIFNQHGGLVTDGYRLTMFAPEGEIYYAFDGADPRMSGGGISPDAIAYGLTESDRLVIEGSAVKVMVPQDDALGITWVARTFDDGNWTTGTSGVGFETTSGYEDLIGADVEDAMYDVNGTVYIRIPFVVDELAAIEGLTLRMKYDDGFIAYVNGLEVAQQNAPEVSRWDSTATATHPDSQARNFADFDVSAALPLLREGRNVFAIHGLNASAASSDFLVLPELVARSSAGPTLALSRTVKIRARALSDAGWSAASEATFVVDVQSTLRVTEVHYHPPAPAEPGSPYLADDFEFIELRNIGDEPIGLAGTRIAGGVEFDFTGGEVAVLDPGEYVLVVENLEAFSSRQDTSKIFIAGKFYGKLDNGGEVIQLIDARGETVLDFAYDDAWYPDTDGAGHSLVIVDDTAPPATWADRPSWRSSAQVGGSPGESDEVSAQGDGAQIPGDVNQDGDTDISDAITILSFLFIGSPAQLPCGDGSPEDEGNLILANPNGDAAIDLTDAIYFLEYLFQGGPPPAQGEECRAMPGCPDVCEA